MLPFATEFPVKPSESRAAFVAEVITWLRGIRASQILSKASDTDLDNEYAHILAETGEELRLREFRSADFWDAIGFRHDLLDGDGRLWRTEAVLRRAAVDGEQDLIRFRTQCLAKRPGAQLQIPRKPYLVKALLNGGWAGVDGEFSVSDQPIWLEDSDSGLATAHAVTIGTASRWLPIVYVSAIGDENWLINSEEIRRLAFDLGGVAHVVVEPSRAFSFGLRDNTDAQNVYGGSIGLVLPQKGVVRKYFVGWQSQSKGDLIAAARSGALGLRGQMPALGWDWTELQEQALRAQRELNSKKLSAEEIEKVYCDEIDNLQDRILQLEEQLSARAASESVGSDDEEHSEGSLVKLVGPELYSGEISDRVRYAAILALSKSDNAGIDRRTISVLNRIVEAIPTSPALGELIEDLDRATKDPKRLAREMTSVLTRHGYRERSDNKHIRLEPCPGFKGLEKITLPKTPSESRGQKNLSRQIARTLGLTKLRQ